MDYTVQAELMLRDNVAEVIRRVGRGFEQINRFIKEAQANLDKFATLGGAVSDMERMVKVSRELAESQAQVARSAVEASRAMREAAAAGRPRSGGGGRPGRAGSGNTHGVMMDAAIGGSMIGGASMGFFEHAFEAAATVDDLLNSLAMNTQISPAMIAQARAKAEEIARTVPGTKVADNVKMILDTFTSVGDLQEAMGGAEAVARLQRVYARLPGEHHGDTAFAGIQAIEVMQRFYDPRTHQVDMATLNQQMAAMTQVAVGTSGRATPEAYLAFAKQSRMGGMMANDQFLYRDLPAMMIALGGSRAGTGDAGVWRQFMQGRMTQSALVELQKVGLVDSSAKWKHGRVDNMMQHLVGGREMAVNPVDWARHFGIPTLDRGIDPNDRLAMGNKIGSFASTAVGLGFLSEMILGMRGIDKESAKIGNTTNNPMAVLANSPGQKVDEFHAAENEFMVQLGESTMGPATVALRALTGGLHGLSDFAEGAPNLTGWLAGVAAGLGALAAAAGAASLVIFVGSPLVGGLRSLAAQAATTTPQLWGAAAALGKFAGWLGIVITTAMALGDFAHWADSQNQTLRNLDNWTRDHARSLLGMPPLTPNAPAQNPQDRTTDAPNAWRHPASYRQPAPHTATPIRNVIYLDGQVLYDNHINRLARDLERAPNGTGPFDSRMSPMFPSTI